MWWKWVYREVIGSHGEYNNIDFEWYYNISQNNVIKNEYLIGSLAGNTHLSNIHITKQHEPPYQYHIYVIILWWVIIFFNDAYARLQNISIWMIIIIFIYFCSLYIFILDRHFWRSCIAIYDNIVTQIYNNVDMLLSFAIFSSYLYL